MKKLWIALSILLLTCGYSYAAGTCGTAGKTGTSPFTANSLGLSDVSACVNTHMVKGETLNLPAGTASWATYLTVAKAITIVGAGNGTGAGDTIITSTATAPPDNESERPDNYMIRVDVTALANFEGTRLRIRNFRMIGSGTIGHFYFRYSYPITPDIATAPRLEFRVDNMVLTNCIAQPFGGYNQGWNTFYIEGLWNGLVDNNTMTGNPLFKINGAGALYVGGTLYRLGRYEWRTESYNAAPENAIYIENNTMTWASTNSLSTYYGVSNDAGVYLTSIGWGASAVFRYNTVVSSMNKITLWGKTHGVGGGGGETGIHGGRGLQMYGNYFTSNWSGTEQYVLLHWLESGRNLIFYNKSVSGAGSNNYAKVSSLYCLPYNDTVRTGLAVCPTGIDYLYPGTDTCSVSDSPVAPMHPNRNFQWNNRYNNQADGTGSLFTAAKTMTSNSWCNGTTVTVKPKENEQWWVDNANCTGAFCESGIGCGSSLPLRCTTNTAYWLTSQSCSTVPTASMGASPTTPIAGTLYRCGPTNTWTAYYTPYTFPHPFVGAADTTPPTMSLPCAGIGSCAAPIIEQTCAASPVSVTMGLTTNENATCKYNASGADSAGADATAKYIAMDSVFSGAGTTTHRATVSKACGDTYSYNVRCRDTALNAVADSLTYSFTVAAAVSTPATVTNITVENKGCSVQSGLKVSTNVPASCGWCLESATCDTDTEYADMTKFTVTGGDTVHHNVSVTQACSSTETYWVSCINSNGDEGDSISVAITTDAAKAVALTGGSLAIGTGGTLSITIIP